MPERNIGTDQELTEQAYSDGKTDGPEQRMLRKDEAMNGLSDPSLSGRTL